MDSEKDILFKMNKTLHEFLSQLCKTQLDIINIQKDVQQLPNNYFTEDKDQIYDQILNIFDEQCVNNLMLEIEKCNTIIEDKLMNNCIHEWINDDVDIDVEKTHRITYCKLCEVTKI